MRALLLAAVLVAAGLGHARAAAPPGEAPPVEAIVTIDNFTFRPAEIVVTAGTRVTWINQDDIPHLVVGKNGTALMKSPPLDTDDRFSAVFDTPGDYTYFCSMHPHMQGLVAVR